MASSRAGTAKTARTISFRQGEKVNTRALRSMLAQIVAKNRAGGWRKLKASHTAGGTR
jgi:hypothetical protein